MRSKKQLSEGCGILSKCITCIMSFLYLSQQTIVNTECLLVKTGHVEVMQGEWAVGHSADGSRNDLQMFVQNPQYLLT